MGKLLFSVDVSRDGDDAVSAVILAF